MWAITNIRSFQLCRDDNSPLFCCCRALRFSSVSLALACCFAQRGTHEWRAHAAHGIVGTTIYAILYGDYSFSASFLLPCCLLLLFDYPVRYCYSARPLIMPVRSAACVSCMNFYLYYFIFVRSSQCVSRRDTLFAF